MERWITDGLVDIVVVGGGFISFETPVREFVEAAEGTDCLVYGCIEATRHVDEDAIRALSRAVPMAPRDPEVFALLGKSYLALRRYRSAIQNLDRAVALDARMAEELAQELEEVKRRRD